MKSAKRKVVNAQLFMGDPQITNPQIFHDISFQKFVHCRPFIEKPAKTQLYACSVIFFYMFEGSTNFIYLFFTIHMHKDSHSITFAEILFVKFKSE